ncbi:MAG: TRAP transporter large permease [Alcaligenaceae bacterium]|nr:TRAP transporter large permease [Alcaligenaceae bacterium]
MAIALMFLGLVALIIINIPIAVALAIVGAAGTYLTYGPTSLPEVPLVLFDGSTNFSLLAIPLFIFAGALMNNSSLAKRLIDLATALLGFIRGGLSLVTIGSSAFFAEISGSAVAGVAALGSVLIPAMRSRGYSREFAAAISSSAASLAIILPPSIPMIIYAVMAQVSIVKMFVAGVLPGLVGALGLAAVSYYIARKRNFPVEAKFEMPRLLVALKNAFWALTIPVIILGGIFGGLVTATEGAGLAVAVSLIISGVIYRELTLEKLYRACVQSGIQTAVVMLLVAASALVGSYLTQAQLPQQLAASIESFSSNKYVILFILNIFFLVLGMFLHSAAAIILVIPIVMPLVHAVGIDPIHFGLVVTLNLAIGQQTPPVASVLITACSIAKSDVWKTTRENLGFIGVLIAVLIVNTYIPDISLILVHLFYGAG